MSSITSPVLLLLFNRPEHTRTLIEAIKPFQLRRVTVACDYPHANDKENQLKVNQVKQIIRDEIDWPCELRTLYTEKHLGCKIACSSAITEFFNHEDYGIILEDDCIPNPSFIPYCDYLLKKYQFNQNVWQISGNSTFNLSQVQLKSDYFYSFYGSVWGWATWADRWQHYTVNLSGYNKKDYDSKLKGLGFKNVEREFRLDQINKIIDGYDTWDIQWTYAKLLNSGLSIVPRVNLIKNIGFGSNSTHTRNEDHPRANQETFALSLPLLAPKEVNCHRELDDRYYKEFINPHPIKHTIKRLLKF